MKLKNNKGLTLIALTVTVIILLLITGTILYNTKNQVSVKKIDNLYVDINAISSKVDVYYLKYGELPVLCEYLEQADFIELLNTNATSKNATLSNSEAVNSNDSTDYYVIDLEKLEDLSLNYGYDDEYETIKKNKSYTASAVEDEIYVINGQTHQIYFPHGVFVDGVMYYTSSDADFTEANVEIPPKSGKVLREGINVGDYINYEPDSGEYELSTLTTYSGSTYNTGNDDGKITTSDMGTVRWQVLRIYDDGSMDIISTPTTKTIYFQGALGYNNGVYLMNDICSTLYSKTVNGNKIEARSINLEDMEYWLTDEGKTEKSNYISNEVASLSTGTYITNIDTANNRVTYVTERSYYPMLYKEQNGSGINTTTVKEDGISESNKYYTLETMISNEEEVTSYAQATSGLTITKTYYNISIDSTNYGEGATVLSNPNSYWVGTRFVDAYYYAAGFGLRFADSEMNGNLTFDSLPGYNDDNYRLRAVVTLGADVQIKKCTGINDKTNMHEITSYGD